MIVILLSIKQWKITGYNLCICKYEVIFFATVVNEIMDGKESRGGVYDN